MSFFGFASVASGSKAKETLNQIEWNWQMANIELQFRNIMRSIPFITVGAWWVVKIGTSDSENTVKNVMLKKP